MEFLINLVMFIVGAIIWLWALVFALERERTGWAIAIFFGGPILGGIALVILRDVPPVTSKNFTSTSSGYSQNLSNSSTDDYMRLYTSSNGYQKDLARSKEPSLFDLVSPFPTVEQVDAHNAYVKEQERRNQEYLDRKYPGKDR